MDTELVKRGLGFAKKRRKWFIALGLIGFSSYGAYKVYHKPSVVRQRKRIMKLFGAIISLSEVVSDSTETINFVSKDLKQFLDSDSDELPNSLKQLSKITRSGEFSESLTRVFQALTVGILSGCNKTDRSDSEIQETSPSNFGARVMDRLMSKSGTGFVSIIIGSFARNLVVGFHGKKSEGNSGSSGWLSLITDDKSRALIGDCIKNFVTTAVDVYLSKTVDINLYEEVFSGLTNPKHRNEMKDLLASLCNGAIETLTKTSHEVLTTSSKQKLITGCNDSFQFMDRGEAGNGKRDFVARDYDVSKKVNRKFVLDVTGRVTFETVRSVMEFFALKASDGVKRSLNVVRDEVLGKRFEVVRFAGAKSSVVLTVLLALLLHVLWSTRVLLLSA